MDNEGFQDSLQNWINQLWLYPCVCRLWRDHYAAVITTVPSQAHLHISTPPPHMRRLSHNCHNYGDNPHCTDHQESARNTGLLWLAYPIHSSRPFGHVLTVLCVIVLCELHGFIVHCLLAMQMWNSNSNSPLGTHIIIINIAQCGVLGRCKCSVTSISRLQSEGAVSGPAPRCVFSI